MLFLSKCQRFQTIRIRTPDTDILISPDRLCGLRLTAPKLYPIDRLDYLGNVILRAKGVPCSDIVVTPKTIINSPIEIVHNGLTAQELLSEGFHRALNEKELERVHESIYELIELVKAQNLTMKDSTI